MKYKKPTPRDLRKANRSQILRIIYFNGEISRLEISQEIGISPATVTNIVSDLLSENILVESGIRRSEGGRPSTLLKINPRYGYFIGIEVGETYIYAELFDILFNQINQIYHPLAGEKIDPYQIVRLLVDSIEDIIRKANLNQKDIIGVGIGFPGLVDPEKGVSIFTPNWGWHDVSITTLLQERLSIPIYLDNGAKVMAIAEMLFGAGRGVNNLAVLLVGTGVGSGIISDRKLFRGSSNYAGEFGHTTLNIEGPLCRCGSHGCLEVYVGASGIINRYQEFAPHSTPLPADDQISSLQKIIDEYRAGEPAAVETIQETIRYLGAGVGNLIDAYNPELLLLGGWSGIMLGSEFMSLIVDAASKYALRQSFAKTTISICELGQGAVAMGAAALALEHFFENSSETESGVIEG